MARVLSRGFLFATISSRPIFSSTLHRLPASSPTTPPPLSSSSSSPSSPILFPPMASDSSPRIPSRFGAIYSIMRGLRKARRGPPAKKKTTTTKKKEGLELSVKICIEEGLPNDPQIMSIAEMLKLNAPMAMKIALDGLKDSEYKTRDASITDVGKFEEIELSVLLCNDEFMQKLNKEWRGVDNTTDVLSMSQHVPELDLPILMLGDIVVSIDTAAKQAEERGHTLLDEIRILMVHGLLHLLGFDHELSEEAEAEMGKEEELILASLGWKGKGLIKSAYDSLTDESFEPGSSDSSR